MSLTSFQISQANLLGYIAAALVFVTFWMKTMVPLLRLLRVRQESPARGERLFGEMV